MRVAGNISSVELKPSVSNGIARIHMASKNPESRKSRAGSATAKMGQGGARAKRLAKGEVRESQNLLERGDLYFFYRPDVDEEAPQGLLDVRRFHVVLRPEGKDVFRLITIGRKKLPDAAEGSQNHWGFVERVFRDAEELREALSGSTYETETVGERRLPEARPVGEGVYAMVRHGRSTVLAYALELPNEIGEVQKAFHIEHEGRFEIAIKNPDAGSPSGVGLDDDRRADMPEELKERFGDRRWVPADPEFLDCEGAELVLIGAGISPSFTLGLTSNRNRRMRRVPRSSRISISTVPSGPSSPCSRGRGSERGFPDDRSGPDRTRIVTTEKTDEHGSRRNELYVLIFSV